MGRPRKRRPTEPGYLFGLSGEDDLLFASELLRARYEYDLIQQGSTKFRARVEGGIIARRFLQDPYPISPDAVWALIDDSDSRVRNIRLAFVPPDRAYSVQLNFLGDDRGALALVALVVGCPVQGESGRHGQLIYDCQDVFRRHRDKLPARDALLVPLERAGGLHGMAAVEKDRVLGFRGKRYTPGYYRKRRHDLRLASMWVEAYHDLPDVKLDPDADRVRLIAPKLASFLRYADTLPEKQQATQIAEVKRRLGLADFPDRDLWDLADSPKCSPNRTV